MHGDPRFLTGASKTPDRPRFGLSKNERPILDHHAKAHNFEIREIQQISPLKSGGFHEIQQISP